LSTHEKIAVIDEQSWTSRTAKSAHGVACTSLRRLGHLARALDWVPRIYFFPFFLSDHPLQGAHIAQKRPAKDAPKLTVHLSNPRGRTWTARDQFPAPFAVVKQYYIAGKNPNKRTNKRTSGVFLSQHSEQWLQDFFSENDFHSNVENLSRVSLLG